MKFVGLAIHTSAIIVAFCSGVVISKSARTAAPEVRGTWLTTTGVDHIKSGTNTPVVMSDLRTIGLNTVYVETWKNGYTNFPSPTLDAIPNAPDRSTFLGTRDLLQETLIHAHRNQLDYVGWFEYGFSAQFVGNGGSPSNPLANYMRDQGWLLKDQTGKYGNASNGFAWMNPAVPQVRQFLINIALDAVNRYDLDGIQFDDRLAWPKEFGWDSTTAHIYLAETGNSLPSSVTDSQFRAWRQSKVTQFANELSQAIRATRPGLLLSVSPSITGWSDTEYNAKWTDWQDQGLFDEYVPQAYRSSLSAFNSIVDAQTNPFLPDDLGEVAIGISINTSPTPSFTDIQGMIQRTRTEGAAGHSLWYSAGSRDLYGSQLTSFYDVAGQGHAENPHFGASHRPSPLVATQVSVPAGTWSASISASGHFRVVAQFGSFWSEVDAVTLTPGEFVMTVPGATQVELLADRRPFDPDFNADATIDASDFVVWKKLLGSTTELRADASANGIVDSADYDWWRRKFGQSVDSGAGAGTQGLPVPEPNTAVAFVVTYVVFFQELRRKLK